MNFLHLVNWQSTLALGSAPTDLDNGRYSKVVPSLEASEVNQLKGENDTAKRSCARTGFVVVAIFKDEAFILAEWMSLNRWQGAKQFFLTDNGSSDGWMKEIGTLRDVTIATRVEKYKQTEHYDSYPPVLREKHMCDWALVVDIDEYLYPKPPSASLVEFFASVPSDVREEPGEYKAHRLAADESLRDPVQGVF